MYSRENVDGKHTYQVDKAKRNEDLKVELISEDYFNVMNTLPMSLEQLS